MGEITKGKINKPLLLLLYGPDKVGKSSFAASAPAPFFLDFEHGSDNLDVEREYPKTFHEAKSSIQDVGKRKDIKTIVIDTLDWLQSLVYEQVLAERAPTSETISDIGWGKGYPVAVKKWKEIIEELEICRAGGKNIILLAHSVLKKYEDPTAPQGYDRYQLNLYDGSTTSKTESVSDLFKQWVDAVLFASFKVYPNANDPRRAYGDGTRVIYPERRPAYDAGNRFGLTDEMPLSDWDSLLAKIYPKPSEAETELREIVKGMAAKIQDEAIRKKVEEAIPKKKTLIELQQLKTKIEGVLK